MKHFLEEILADPLTGNRLTEQTSGGEHFLSSGDLSYKITGDVPILLPQKDVIQSNPDLHKKSGSNFDYTIHYQEDARHFDYFNEEVSLSTKEEIRRLHQAIIHRIPRKAQLILDIGCGNGWAAEHFLAKGKKVISMDISLINPMKVLKNNPGENHAAVVADAYHLPFRKNSIDAIIASEIMEHVYDPKLFIEKLGEVLKPGGKLVITTPYNEKIEYFLCVHCNRPTPKNAHLHSFNEKNISDFIPGGFTDYTTSHFSNKYFVRLRLNLLVSFLPFAVWKLKDSLINLIFKKPLRFLIELNKKSIIQK